MFLRKWKQNDCDRNFLLLEADFIHWCGVKAGALMVDAHFCCFNFKGSQNVGVDSFR